MPAYSSTVRGPTKEVIRMMYIRKLHTSIFSLVFNDMDKLIKTRMFNIAQKNKALINCNTATFIFEGTWYPHGKPLTDEDNRELHHSLRKEVYELVHSVNHDDLEVQRNIKTLIGNILAVAKNTADVLEMLPDELAYGMPALDPEIFNIGDPLPKDKIEEFKVMNAFNSEKLNELLITRLLLSKV